MKRGVLHLESPELKPHASPHAIRNGVAVAGSVCDDSYTGQFEASSVLSRKITNDGCVGYTEDCAETILKYPGTIHTAVALNVAAVHLHHAAFKVAILHEPCPLLAGLRTYQIGVR